MPVQNVTAKQTSTMMKLPYKIAKQNKVIIMGTHEQSGLCSIPTSPMPVQQANGILLLNKTNRELPNYHHASLGSPAKSTLLQAIRRGHLTTFQGINFQAHITHQSHSAGSSRPNSKHLCSTKPFTHEVTKNQPDTDLTPVAESNTNVICSTLFCLLSL